MISYRIHIIQHGVPGIGENGVPGIVEYGVPGIGEHGVHWISKYGVPGIGAPLLVRKSTREVGAPLLVST